MRYLVVANPKGGQAKTTSAVNLAFGLAQNGSNRVALIDFDPKNDLSDMFGVDAFDESNPTVGEVITLDESLRVDPRDALMPIGDGIDLLPATMHLEGIGASLYSLGSEKILRHLKDRLAPLEQTHDWVVIDTAGASGPLPFAAFGAADELVIAVNPQHAQGVRGLLIIDHVLAELKLQGALDLEVSMVLFTHVEGRIKEVVMNMGRVVDAEFPIAPSKVKKNVDVVRAEGIGRPIIELLPDHQASIAYRKLAVELLARDQMKVSKLVEKGIAVG